MVVSSGPINQMSVVEMASSLQQHEEARWSDLNKILDRPGPMSHPDFEPGEEVRIIS